MFIHWNKRSLFQIIARSLFLITTTRFNNNVLIFSPEKTINTFYYQHKFTLQLSFITNDLTITQQLQMFTQITRPS